MWRIAATAELTRRGKIEAEEWGPLPGPIPLPGSDFSLPFHSADPDAAEGSRPTPGPPRRLRRGVATGGVGGVAPGKDRLCLPGSDLARKRLRWERPVTSAICPVEIESMLRRSRSEGRLTEGQGRGARAIFARDLGYWNLIDVDGEVLQPARQVAADYPIRALDALHIASALRLRERFPATEFLSADRRQAEVAAALGFPVPPVVPQS